MILRGEHERHGGGILAGIASKSQRLSVTRQRIVAGDREDKGMGRNAEGVMEWMKLPQEMEEIEEIVLE